MSVRWTAAIASALLGCCAIACGGPGGGVDGSRVDGARDVDAADADSADREASDAAPPDDAAVDAADVPVDGPSAGDASGDGDALPVDAPLDQRDARRETAVRDAGPRPDSSLPGWSCTATNPDGGVPCTPARLVDLDQFGVPAGYGSAALDINDKGDVVMGGLFTYWGVYVSAQRCVAPVPIAATLPDHTRDGTGLAPGYKASLNAWSTVVVTVDGSNGFIAALCNGTCLGFREAVPTASGAKYAQAFGYAINDRDQIVGTQAFSFGPNLAPRYLHAFIWDAFQATDLTSSYTVPPGPNATPVGPDIALAVNNAGLVAGYSNGRAVVWSNGVKKELGTLGTGAYSRALGLNDDGQVIGVSTVSPTGPTHAFIWDADRMTDLGTLGGVSSVPTAINASGQVAGSSLTADGRTHAFLWTDGTMMDLGTLGGTSSMTSSPEQTLPQDFPWQTRVYAVPLSDDTYLLTYDPKTRRALNDAGQVVGTSTTKAGASHAFVWRDGAMIDLGTLGAGDRSEGVAINSAGAAVGLSTIAGQTRSHTFLYDRAACP